MAAVMFALFPRIFSHLTHELSALNVILRMNVHRLAVAIAFNKVSIVVPPMMLANVQLADKFALVTEDLKSTFPVPGEGVEHLAMGFRFARAVDP